MEDDFLSYLPPLKKLPSSSSLSWSIELVVLLKRMQKGRVQSGNHLVQAIGFLREALSFPSETISKPARRGYYQIFDEVMRSDESSKWFNEVVPKLARLLLKLPSLLEAHYENNGLMDIHGDASMVTTALRVLESQRAGVVCLSQELIAALLACSFFCLYPNTRTKRDMRTIYQWSTSINCLRNYSFDFPFNSLLQSLVYLSYFEHVLLYFTCLLFSFLILLNLLFCETHDFFGVFRALDKNRSKKVRDKIWCIIVYFERIHFDKPMGIVSFERRVHTSGLVEDQSSGAVEVYFAGKNIGGDALGSGTSHAETRFMLSPELIAGMLFLPAMNDNEAIEIVGAERFLTYDDYESSFRFSDVYVDKTELDSLGRRKTRIVAVDKLCTPKDSSEYTGNIYLREINKAFCGFVHRQCENNIIMGVSSGDRECDSDLEMNVIIKWLAASQAERPFVAYCTFGRKELKNLGQVADWISSQGWTVGDVWNKLMEYAFLRCHIQGFDDCFSQWVQREKRHRLLTTLAQKVYHEEGGHNSVLKRHKPTQDGLTGLKS